MTGADSSQWPYDVPDADLAEQQIPVDAGDDEETDPSQLVDAGAMEADPADLIDQAISVPLPVDDYEFEP
jgi:hypothetical protein